ncbi:alpha-2-macroglobulin [Luteimonas sp. MC1572]|uniref:alpha-2-macroglobulin family protein n=1 Tax=Luteimonas sp. MC1572 TaxID=2799325 RepID=UPI0018F0662D|nr:alpha-2-macroglobulin [Luteimonas sp. MC1572]MBJ6980697.1 alpha-2-macroglobulin family protein [Luteimonas sp. MC1572]QQO02072.1 alpha-2-macroglobulin family protein [Luteimonas sp. MC1572]
MRNGKDTLRPRRGVLHALAIVAALALLALGGCKRDESGQLPAPGGEAIQAERAEVEGFGLVRAWPDQSEGSLSLAVEFSRPLVGTQDFDRLLTFAEPVAGDSSWSLDDDGRVLRFPFAEADREYTLRISGALTAADGSTLGQDIERKVSTGELKPVVGFASQGSVLPARESRGLPVVSVNVEEVDVEFLRVPEASLPRFYAEYQRGGRRSGWELDNDYRQGKSVARLAEPVYVNRFVLGGERNERLLTYLPIQSIPELQQPGLYFAVMKKAGSFGDMFETAFFTVSDIGLHLRAYKDQLFVHTASLQTGAALGGVDLRVLGANGEAVFKSTTDGNGNAVLDHKLVAAQVLVATRGKDVSLLPFNQPALDLSEFAVAGRGNAWFDVFAWSGRDLYRPGETVRVSALLRDADGKPVPAAKDGKAQPLFARLKQPDGKTFIESRLEAGAQGYYRFEREIPVEAATGRWQLEFRTDPASREAVQGIALRIEEFLPERMKLELDSAQVLLKPGEPLRLSASGAYLYGAPAAGNRFTAKMSVAVEQHPLEGLPGYFFGDPTVQLPRDARDVVDASLDARGVLAQDIALPAEVVATTPVAVVVAGSLYESGGRSVNRSLKRVLWPADALVGVRPLFDDKEGSDANASARFELVRVGSDGKPRPAKGLELSLVREHRDYHWNFNDDGGWNYDFTRRFEVVEKRGIDAGATAARFDVPVEWGEYRVEVRDPATGLVTRYPFRAGWSWGDENRGPDARPDKVKLSLDKTGYRAGDTLEVTVTPPHAGKGLLLVESDRLLYVQAIDARAGSTFRIPVGEDWERHDVYVTALVFRGGSATSKVTPARAVGVAHVPMARGDRRAAVGMSLPTKAVPGEVLKVTVSAPALAGQLAHATVSAVDVGILNITRYAVPDANRHFFAQRRLGTDAYDIYGRVIESFDGGSARLRFGGDVGLAALPQARRPTARVQTVDLFSGPVRLDAKGNARVEFTMPDFNGTLRVSTLVYGDTQYGNRDAELLVRAPLVAEAGMPRVMAPGDAATVTLDLTNFTGKPGTFRVRVEGEGPLDVGDGTRDVALAAEGKTTLSFPLSARDGHAVARVRVRVDGPGVKVDRRHDLPVRAPWPQVVRTRAMTLDPLAPVVLGTDLAEGLLPGSVQARLGVGALPPIPFASALQGALDYPYGCAEQTTSKGYAALVLDASTAATYGMTPLPANDRTRRMEGALGRLAALQSSSGHFSMWGGADGSDAMLTPYAAEFMLDAREAGFDVPEAMLQKALSRLSEDLLSDGQQFYGRDNREHLRFAYKAHAGYVLARVSRAPLGTLRAMYDNERKVLRGPMPLAHLGLALSLQGDKVRGQKALDEAFVSSGQRPGYLGDYGTPLRDAALMLGLARAHGLAPKRWDARLVALGRELEARRKARWFHLSTQEQAAIARLGKTLATGPGREVSGTLTEGGVDEAITPTRYFSRGYGHEALAKGVRFVPQGTPPLYASIEVAGIPRSAPEPDASAIRVERAWFATDGKPWTPRPLKEGEALVARVSITADRDMPDALLTDLLPAGLEVENMNLGDAGQWAEVVIDGISLSERANAAELRHEEFRDDRYVAALSLDAGNAAHVFYLVRAVTPGRYTVPPPLVEDMYRPELRGVGHARPAQMTVVQP